jgi:hypothetical protein
MRICHVREDIPAAPQAVSPGKRRACKESWAEQSVKEFQKNRPSVTLLLK